MVTSDNRTIRMPNLTTVLRCLASQILDGAGRGPRLWLAWDYPASPGDIAYQVSLVISGSGARRADVAPDPPAQLSIGPVPVRRWGDRARRTVEHAARRRQSETTVGP
jgi:hypothetical protein